jgi:hypothetical protein
VLLRRRDLGELGGCGCRRRSRVVHFAELGHGILHWSGFRVASVSGYAPSPPQKRAYSYI